jgi:hypothetical protein
MRPPITDGTALITGASSGIGRELARQLARSCRTLVLVARRVDRLERLRDELHERNPTLGLVLEPCDISKPHEVDGMLSELSRHLVQVDILVNNAGQGERGLYEQASWARIEQVLQVNVVALALLTHRLLGPMIERKRGGILNVGSGVGQLFLPGAAAYAATRHFLDGFTESLRLEVEGTGVVVTQVAPGPVRETEFEQVAGGDEAPTPLFAISARQCAREALEGFERGEPLVYPGRGHRWMMRLLPALPRALKRGLGRLASRGLRDTALLGPPHPDERLLQRVLLAGEPWSV